MKTIDTLDNDVFRHLITTIGALPTSFIDSMSYYEMIAWLVDYIKKNVIPAINNHAEALQEIQNWIETLDLQDEVDTKLDEMVSDGTMAEIINQEIFGELNETVNGLSSSVDTINNTTIPALDSRLDSVEDTLEDMTTEEYIIIGDSYGAASNSWINQLTSKIGIRATCHKVAHVGIGFYHQSSQGNFTFKSYLEDQADRFTHPERINKIIVCGGYNDYNETTANIEAGIANFCEYCHTTYPNAQVYIGMIGFNKAYTAESGTIRAKLNKVVLPAYSKNYNLSYAPIFIPNTDKIMKNVNYIGADNIHPTEAGQTAIAKALYNWWLGGTIETGITNTQVTFTHESGATFYTRTNEVVRIVSVNPITFTFATPITINAGSGSAGFTEIDDFTADCFFPANDYECLVPVTASVVSDGTTYRNIPMMFGYTALGKAVVYYYKFAEGGSAAQPFTNVTSLKIEDPLNICVSATYN